MKKKKFINSFMKGNAIYTPTNDMFFNINNCLNNLILEFFE